jgi:hypothetical protein
MTPRQLARRRVVARRVMRLFAVVFLLVGAGFLVLDAARLGVLALVFLVASAFLGLTWLPSNTRRR